MLLLTSTLLLVSYQLTAPPGAGLAPIRASAVRMSAAEDAAKAAWLAKQDAPAFAPRRMSSAGEAAAKAAWLAKMDAPAWGKAAEAVASASASAAMTEAAEEACDQGVTAACDGLSREEEAKRAWLAKMDKPSWGAVTAAVAAVSSEVTSVAGRSVGGAMTAEEIAKHKWLSSVPELTL